MSPAIPWYLTLITLATNLTIAVSVWRIFASAAGRSGLAPRTQRRIRDAIPLFLAAWLGLALLLAPAPASLLARDRFYLTPLIPLFATLGPALVILALGFSPSLRRVVSAASLPAMIGVQVYRTIGIVFLVLLALGRAPAHFALPAGWGDIAIGAAAPLVALALARAVPGARALAIGWNVAGLLDLVVAVGMGTGFLAPLLAPSLGARVPPVPVMGVFPMILVPTFAVPVSVLLHLLALGRLAREGRLGSLHASGAKPLATG
jgi:hypothetical protein